MVNSEPEIIKVCLKGAERGAIFSRDLDGMALRVTVIQCHCMLSLNMSVTLLPFEYQTVLHLYHDFTTTHVIENRNHNF